MRSSIMKVLGTKVSDTMYNQFTSLDGSISENLKKAINLYLNQYGNQEVNLGKPNDNAKTFTDEYQDLVNELISLTDRFYEDLSHLMELKE